MEATELFSLCRRLAEEGPSADATRRMHELLVLTCAEGCRRRGGTFGGLFSQVDYLCKQHGIEGEERREVQTMRRHSNSYEAVDSREWPYDLRALSRLIEAVFSEDVPGSLRRLLPSQPRPREKGLSINQRYVRCIVTTWDEHYIVASTDDGDICIDYTNTTDGRDFAYLRRLLREGMQLNLLDCHVECEVRSEERGVRSVVTPGLVVVEPDFLLDISSIAACFTNYGHHPLLYTVNRMKPKPNTQAVLLGNFAGAALDDLIHSGVRSGESGEWRVESGESVECRVDSGESVEWRVESGESVECRVESVEFATAPQDTTAEKGGAVANSKLYTLNSKLDHAVANSKLSTINYKLDHAVANSKLYTLNSKLDHAVANSKLFTINYKLDHAVANSKLSTINYPLSTINYKLSPTLHRSFREQALRFCACKDFEPEKFKCDAATQLKNIQEAVDVLFCQSAATDRLHSDNAHYDRENALLEPSFVCERLGLQGRVDLMTTDLKLLVEQKSGKNPKIEHQSHDAHGMQLESHYVQLLLYYGILRYNFDRTDKNVDIRLLYSRYPAAQGLMAVSYYQQLFREAIRLRNQIVATELLIAREGFGRIMPHLSSSVIYKEVRKDRIFHEYVEPELAAVVAPLATLSPLERAYYERMMTFVYREQASQKLGSSEARLHHSGGAASDLWQMPLSEKQESGNIFTGLKVSKLDRSSAYSSYDCVKLALSTAMSGQENFRRGDMVYLYAYKNQPDVRESILYKGTLDEIGVETITVRLTNGQQNPDLFMTKDTCWAVEHASADSGSSASIRSMQQFITALPDRRALLLGQRPPRADQSVRLSQSYHPNYDDIVLRASQARDYFLLVGPPGTGKTSMALRFLVMESGKLAAARQAHPNGSPDAVTSATLLLSYTNRAVDEICAMLTDAGADYLRIGGESSCDPRFRDHLLEASLEHISKLEDIKKKIMDTPVIVGTTSTLQSRQEIFQLKHFSLAIVDEASQILEPSLVGLLSNEQIDRFILIGDHKQLPAVVQQSEDDSRIDHPLLRERCIDDCRQSLFERLLRWERHEGRTQFIGTLHHQGRMHPDVASFPATLFYANEQLQPVPLPHQQSSSLHYDLPAEDATDQLLKTRRMVFFDAAGYRSPLSNACQTDNDAHHAQANRTEAQIVADLLRRIHRFYGTRFSAEKTVGVIVPYRNQIAMIRQETARLNIPALLDISIDTVERYQGSQRDVIIYSFTVSHDYQLDFLTANTFTEQGHTIDRKLNVALTRARCQMLMVGNAQLLCHNPLFRQLVEKYSL